MERFTYTYSDWILQVDYINNELIFWNNNLDDTTHTYDLPELPVAIEVDGGNIKVIFNLESYYNITFESEYELVIDHYDSDDEFISTIGCYNVEDFM